MTDDSEIPAGTTVKFTSNLGFTYSGSVTSGPDGDGCYTIATGGGAVALVHRSKIEVAETAAPAPELSDEDLQRRADALVTDAVMAMLELRRRAAPDTDRDALRTAAAEDIVAAAGRAQEHLARITASHT